MGHTKGWSLYGPRNKLLAEQTGSMDLPAHHQNFFDSIRQSNVRINADVQAGRLAATVVHLANISARTGAVVTFDPQRERITSSEQADALTRRQYRDHWGTPVIQ
jgi:hypothetical protein